MPVADDIPGPPALLGVAGSREAVANSLSPLMMRAAFDALGIDAQYVALALDEERAEQGLRALAALGFRGCNVTMPFKPLAATVADTRSAMVERTGVANLLVVRADGSVHAEATDGHAFVDAVADRGVVLEGAHITVLGAGGAALEACVAAIDAGVARIDIWNRSCGRADQLLERLQALQVGVELQVHERMPIREPAHVLVGCVPADAIDPQALLDVDAGSLIVDFAYRRDGRATPLMVASAKHSARGVDGRELLVRQAAAAFGAWFGVAAPTKVMERAVR